MNRRSEAAWEARDRAEPPVLDQCRPDSRRRERQEDSRRRDPGGTAAAAGFFVADTAFSLDFTAGCSHNPSWTVMMGNMLQERSSTGDRDSRRGQQNNGMVERTSNNQKPEHGRHPPPSPRRSTRIELCRSRCLCSRLEPRTSPFFSSWQLLLLLFAFWRP